MKVVVAGGTGFLGRPLVAALAEDGNEVVVLTRHPGSPGDAFPSGSRAVGWDADHPDAAWTGELAGAGAVVNLAGASIGGGRWTAARKKAILQSRLDATNALVGAIGVLPAADRPRALVNASGIDYYGDREEPVTEESGPGESFLARVCVEWEAAARRAEAHGVRVVLMRTAPVLGRGAQAYTMLALPFRFFVGGPLGSGEQWWSWIHRDDAIGLYRLAIAREDAVGPINLSAPDARPQRELAREIGRVLGRPSWLPAPELALRLALGEQADLLLHGRRAEPARARQLGYAFRWPELRPALEQSL